MIEGNDIDIFRQESMDVWRHACVEHKETHCDTDPECVRVWKELGVDVSSKCCMIAMKHGEVAMTAACPSAWEGEDFCPS